MDNPELYAKSNEIQEKDVIKVLDKYRCHFKWVKGERILDIGCGPGDVTAVILLPMLPEDSVVVGCDVSEEMVKYANKKYKSHKLSFKQLNIEQKIIGSYWELESFNKIFSFYCLHWIFDHRQAVKNIYSLLKPSGEILLLFLTPDNPVYLAFEKLKKIEKWSKYLKGIKWFYESSDPSAYFSDILIDAGFQETHCYLKTENYHFPCWKDILDLVESVNPYLSHLPADMSSECLNEIGDIMKKENYIKNDEINAGFVVEYNVLITRAKKPE